MEVVNGFRCKDCTDIDYAKRHIDPAHPKDGPYGINAATNPERQGEQARAPSVTLDGALSGAADPPGQARSALGGRLDLTA